jgi:hypothetical protein
LVRSPISGDQVDVGPGELADELWLDYYKPALQNSLEGTTNMSRKPPINPDVDEIADWAKWGYATGTRLISALILHLAKLAGTGRIDPDQSMFLQEGLAGIYDALYMGTVSAVRDDEDAYLQDDNTYSDGRQVSIKIRVEPIEESVNRWEHNQFLLRDDGVFEYPRGIIAYISPPTPGHSMSAWHEDEVLNHFSEDQD